jgi:hypothetical protein
MKGDYISSFKYSRRQFPQDEILIRETFGNLDLIIPAPELPVSGSMGMFSACS